MKVKDLYLLPVSSKGQVTIPVQIRKVLALEERKKIILELLENHQVIIKAPKFTLEEVFGKVALIRKSFSQIRKIAKEERIKRHL